MPEGNKLEYQMCEIIEEFKMFKANYLKPHDMYSIKLQLSLYELKQFEHMWYIPLVKMF